MWRLLEVGEKRERGDEIFSMSSGDGWFECSNLAIGSTVRKDHAPCRRRVPDQGADSCAFDNRPEKLVKLGDRVTVKSGTWSGCTGRVFAIDQKRGMPTRVGLTLDNVFAGGHALTLWESADNVAVLVEPVAVDPEWRLLEIGEVIREGDEHDLNSQWGRVTGAIGSKKMVGHLPIRRRVRIESPGWRYMDAGEVVQAGDEIKMTSGSWDKVSHSAGGKVGDNQGDGRIYFFRRKTAPFAG